MDNGIYGGIGEGLSQFAQAYQTALNYRMEKAKAEALADVAQQNAATGEARQQADAQYQQALAGVAVKNALTERAQARAKLLEVGGSGALDYYGKDILPEDTSSPDSASPSDQDAQSPPQPAPKGLINPLPPGMVGPQPSDQMVQDSQKQAAGLVNANPQPGMIPRGQPSSKPFIVAPWQRQYMLAQKTKVDELNAEEQKNGSGKVWVQDPNSGAPVVAFQGPLTGNAAIERRQKEAQIQGEISGSRGPKNTIATDYQTAVKPFEESQRYTQQALANWNHRSPAGDAATALTAFRIKFPNAPDVNSLEELKKSPALPDQWRNELNKAGTGLFSDDFMKQLMQDIIVTNDANYQSFKGVQRDYGGRAKGSGVDDTSFMSRNAIERTHKDSDSLLGKLGEYKPANQRPDAGYLTKFLGSLAGNNSVTTNQNNFTPDVTAYARQHGITNQQALAIKMKRTGGR